MKFMKWNMFITICRRLRIHPSVHHFYFAHNFAIIGCINFLFEPYNLFMHWNSFLCFCCRVHTHMPAMYKYVHPSSSGSPPVQGIVQSDINTLGKKCVKCKWNWRYKIQVMQI
jgi:hypothetical protein